MTDTPDNPLAFITNEDLLNELASRFDAIFFAASLDRSDTEESLVCVCTGTNVQAAGLSVAVQRKAMMMMDAALIGPFLGEPDEDDID